MHLCVCKPFFDLFVSSFLNILANLEAKSKSDAEHKQIEAALDTTTEMHAVQTALVESDAKIGSFILSIATKRTLNPQKCCTWAIIAADFNSLWGLTALWVSAAPYFPAFNPPRVSDTLAYIEFF